MNSSTTILLLSLLRGLYYLKRSISPVNPAVSRHAQGAPRRPGREGGSRTAEAWAAPAFFRRPGATLPTLAHRGKAQPAAYTSLRRRLQVTHYKAKSRIAAFGSWWQKKHTCLELEPSTNLSMPEHFRARDAQGCWHWCCK